jgi:ABC-type Fe3+/spermidine/putrescine transport system ATPase subunit
MAELTVRGLSKTYGETPAVSDFSHTFADGKITTVVGPSGSGKSTTLWMIAGLTRPDRGAIRIDGEEVTHLAAEHREIGMVFQNYALFPHLTVRENVEFGLRVRRVPRAERNKRALETLALTRIEHLSERYPSRISGGEQQRVALARALVIRPKVLLMDEPLSALDAKLREELRGELFRLLNELGVTTVYVTHDQMEAMSLGNDLIVMNEGRIEQVGPPLDVYLRPENTFVANFLGAANAFEGECVLRSGRRRVRLPFTEIDLIDDFPEGPCWAMIRPEDLSIATQKGDAHFHGEFASSVFLGNRLRVSIRVGSIDVVLDVGNDTVIDPRLPIPIRIDTTKVYLRFR